MKPPSLALLRVMLPLLLLGGLGIFLWRAEHEENRGLAPLGSGSSGSFLVREDFSQAPLGGLPVGWEAPRGTFRMVEQNSRRVLEFAAEPMVEGRVLLPGLLTGGGTVRARMQGDRAKRTFPRFGVGLGESSVYKLLARPGEGQLELVEIEQLEVNGMPVENDKVLVAVPWRWQPDAWCWVELSVTGTRSGSRWEGRCWAAGSARPAAPLLIYATPTSPKLVRATIHLSPYALKPIYLDRVETER